MLKNSTQRSLLSLKGIFLLVLAESIYDGHM